MLDGNDRQTFYALRQLRDVVAGREKPILVWAGAGASMWCGFPSWSDAANEVHRAFVKFESRYDRAAGERLLEEQRFPELFEACRQISEQRYHRKLTYLFHPRPLTPVYGRFLSIAKLVAPLQIVTTNVDVMLEQRLPEATIVQGSNLERCVDLIDSRTSFIAKLHGSVSSVEAVVFSSRDYQRIQLDSHYLEALKALFGRATVIFIGYSLRDKYVLDLLASRCGDRPLFGDGPHFVVCSDQPSGLSESVKPIRYVTDVYSDHRSAVLVLDIVRAVKAGPEISFTAEAEARSDDEQRISAYFISDITPAGTWTSSQSLELNRGDGFTPNAVVGQGFSNSELPDKTSSAMHDFVVGLLCFDRIYVPLSYAGRLHDLLGAEMFWIVVRASILRFVYFSDEPVMMFRSLQAVDAGDIGMMHVSAPGGDNRSLTVEECIRTQIRAFPGRETEVGPLFDALAANTVTFDHERFDIPGLTRGALLHPSVQGLLGISDAVLPTSVPRWSCFPVLRLAHTIMFGCASESFALPATKIGFGGEILVGAAFSVAAARDWADTVSSYVLTSRFNTNLGSYVESDRSVLTTLLSFRDRAEGVALRCDVLRELATNEGSEFIASVNAGLRKLIPTAVMQAANDQLSGLLLRRPESHVIPAVWTNMRNSDQTALLWRARRKRELEDVCRSRRIGPDGPCPCASGEKLRFCCQKALTG